MKNAPPLMYYIPDFINEEDEKNLAKAIESESKWQLSDFFKQDWGRVCNPNGEVVLDGGDLPDVLFLLNC